MAKRKKAIRKVMAKAVVKRGPGRPRGSKNASQVERSEVQIPGTSALSAATRRGLEGWCTVCMGSVSSHMTPRGEWLGCPKAEAPHVPFVLVPTDRRSLERRYMRGTRGVNATTAGQEHVEQRVRGKSDDHSGRAAVVAVPIVMARAAIDSLTPATVPASVPQGITRRSYEHVRKFVYAVKDKRRVIPETFPQALRDAYEGLRKASTPLDAQGAADAAGHPREANRRALNALVSKKLIVKQMATA